METCSFCKKKYKSSYFKTHVERVHTDRDNPKYVRLREKSTQYQKTLSKEVIRERAKRYSEKHRDKINCKQREVYDAHHDKKRNYYENYYKEHAEELSAWKKNYYLKNKDKINERRAKRRENETLVLCPICDTLYREEYIERHKQICLGLEVVQPSPVKRKRRTFKVVAKPKEVPQLVNMTITFFDGTAISDDVYLGYYTQ